MRFPREKIQKKGSFVDDYVLVMDGPLSLNPGRGFHFNFENIALAHNLAEEVNDIILESKVYDADLGMPRAAQVQKQLRLDVPRCNVRVDGVETTDWQDVWKSTIYPRMCTQAVLAPVLEWFAKSGILVCETRSRMDVSVFRNTSMKIEKKLRLMRSDRIGSLNVTIHVWKPSVVVSCEINFPDSQVKE